MALVEVKGGSGNVASSLTRIEVEADALIDGVRVVVDDDDDEDGREVERTNGCRVDVAVRAEETSSTDRAEVAEDIADCWPCLSSASRGDLLIKGLRKYSASSNSSIDAAELERRSRSSSTGNCKENGWPLKES